MSFLRTTNRPFTADISGTVTLPKREESDVTILGMGTAGKTTLIALVGRYLNDVYEPYRKGRRADLPPLRITTVEKEEPGHEGEAFRAFNNPLIESSFRLLLGAKTGSLLTMIPHGVRHYFPVAQKRFKHGKTTDTRAEQYRDDELMLAEVLSVIRERRLPITISHTKGEVTGIALSREAEIKTIAELPLTVQYGDSSWSQSMRVPTVITSTFAVIATGAKLDESMSHVRNHDRFCDGANGLEALLERLPVDKPARVLIRGAGLSAMDVLHVLMKLDCAWHIEIVAPKNTPSFNIDFTSEAAKALAKWESMSRPDPLTPRTPAEHFFMQRRFDVHYGELMGDQISSTEDGFCVQGLAPNPHNPEFFDAIIDCARTKRVAMSTPKTVSDVLPIQSERDAPLGNANGYYAYPNPHEPYLATIGRASERQATITSIRHQALTLSQTILPRIFGDRDI